MKIIRNRDLGDESPETAPHDRLAQLMEIAITRHEHGGEHR